MENLKKEGDIDIHVYNIDQLDNEELSFIGSSSNEESPSSSNASG